jgi:hypothetical protein
MFEYRDGTLYRKKSLGRTKAGDKVGFVNSKGYVAVNIDRQCIPVHRLIWVMQHGSMPELIDHIDGNPLNNKIENLRLATSKQNALNRVYKGKIKNVSLCSENNKYKVSLTSSGKRIFLGYFEDFELASLVAAEARQKYHGIYTRGAI